MGGQARKQSTGYVGKPDIFPDSAFLSNCANSIPILRIGLMCFKYSKQAAVDANDFVQATFYEMFLIICGRSKSPFMTPFGAVYTLGRRVQLESGTIVCKSLVWILSIPKEQILLCFFRPSVTMNGRNFRNGRRGSSDFA